MCDNLPELARKISWVR